MRKYRGAIIPLLIIIVFVAFIALYIGIPKQEQQLIELSMEDLDGLTLIRGMAGFDMHLDPSSMKIYVSSFEDGAYVYMIDGKEHQDMHLVRALKISNGLGLGITMGPDSSLIVGCSANDWEDWYKNGGALYKVDPSLNKAEQLSAFFPGLNDVSFDGKDHLYFATINRSKIRPSGAVYCLVQDSAGNWTEPELVLENVKGSSALFFDTISEELCIAEKYSGIVSFNTVTKKSTTVVKKSKWLELFCCFCKDSQGNFWMADAGSGFVKMYNPDREKVFRFAIDGIGSISSCKIRKENGEDILYALEISEDPSFKRAIGKECDGRGIFIVPVRNLLKYI